MNSRKALGRGLDALIPQGSGETSDDILEQVHQIPVGQLAPNPHQPRSQMDDEGLQQLAQSIREQGVLEPLIVRPLDEGSYELIAGERRLRAAILAGMEKVPALLRTFGGRNALEVALIENLQREDLNPVDEARAYQALVDEFGRTHAEISKAVGKDRSTISNLLRILRLPETVLSQVSRGTLSVGHARVLLNVEDPEAQTELAKRMVAEGWSVRQAERFGGHLIEGRRKRSKGKAATSSQEEARASRDPEVLRIEEALRNAFGTEVHLHHSPKGGRIEISYFSNEELERILDLLRIEIH